MHRVFISYHHANDQKYKDGLVKWAKENNIFIDYSVDTGDISDDLTDEQIREKIRDEYLRDSTVTILLVGTGTLAGVIQASDIKDVLVGLLDGWSNGGTFMAPIAGMLMSAASASTTAGATIASASFSDAIMAAGVAAVWGAAMVNAGATVLDHLPHGSFFHATGGSMGLAVKERLKLIPYESLVGLVLTICSVAMYMLV